MSEPLIAIEREGHVLKISINRPAKRNAITVAMYQDIADAFGELDRNPELRAGVVCATGDHFCAGLDLADWQGVITQGSLPWLRPGSCDPFGFDPASTCKKPIVFAVQGITFTFAVEAMLAADIRVAARDSRFAQLEVARGLFPFGGAPIRLVREIGWARSMRYLLTGDEWNAEQALEWGLVQELTEPGGQVNKAMEIAQKIAAQAPLAVQATLALARTAQKFGEQEAFASTFPRLKAIAGSYDIQEGLRAFALRRPGQFRGE